MTIQGLKDRRGTINISRRVSPVGYGGVALFVFVCMDRKMNCRFPSPTYFTKITTFYIKIKKNKNQPKDTNSLRAHINKWCLLKWTDSTNDSNVNAG